MHVFWGEPTCIGVCNGRCQIANLPLYVLKGKGPSLFRRNWLEKIKVAWAEINLVRNQSAIEEVLQKHPNVFTDQIGTLKGVAAKIYINKGTKPLFFKPHPLPTS